MQLTARIFMILIRLCTNAAFLKFCKLAETIHHHQTDCAGHCVANMSYVENINIDH